MKKIIFQLTCAFFTLMTTVVFSSSANAQVVINEVISQNTLIPGPTGFPDIIEIYNLGTSSANLAGYKLSDSGSIWTFPTVAQNPNVIIPAGGYLTVWAPGGSGNAATMSANFGIAAGGETITLLTNAFAPVDSAAVPAMPTNNSFARVPNGTGAFQISSITTVGAANQGSIVTNNPDAVNLKINEVVTSNQSGIQSGSSALFPDWIEIYNTSSTVTVTLAGLKLADSGALWTFPTNTPALSPNGFMIVFASGSGTTNIPANEIHATFSLSAAGETVTLYNNDASTVVDSVIVPAIAPDQSWGSYPDGAGVFGNILTPTPVAANNLPGAAANPDAVNITINEVLADNISGLTTQAGAREDAIELHNKGTVSVNLQNLQLTDGVNFWAFPSYTMNPGDYLVVFASGDNATLTVPLSIVSPQGVEFHTNFSVSSTNGEMVSFINTDGSILESVVVPPMPADISYARIPNATGPFQNVQTPTLGSMNQNGTIAPNPDANLLVLNEIMASNSSTLQAVSTLGFPDWIEIYNTSSTVTVNLGGLKLEDDATTWAFPPNTMLAPNSYLVVYADNQPANPALGELWAGFGISSANGETIKLLNLDNSVVGLVNIPGGILPDVSYGRLPNGTGNYVQITTPTPGIANNQVVVQPNLDALNLTINEVSSDNETLIYDEENDSGDFIEIYNKGNVAVSLDGLKLRDFGNAWPFPQGLTINPGQYLIVFADDKSGNPGLTQLHTNFNLESSGNELVEIINIDNSVIESIPLPAQLSDQSYARIANAIGAHQLVTSSTPGGENVSVIQAQITTPAANTQFTNPTQTFTWSSGNNVSEYYLEIATTPSLLNTLGNGNIYSKSLGTATTIIVNNITLLGSDIYAAVWSKINNVWVRGSLVTYQTQAAHACAFPGFGWNTFIGNGTTPLINDFAVNSLYPSGLFVGKYTGTPTGNAYFNGINPFAFPAPLSANGEDLFLGIFDTNFPGIPYIGQLDGTATAKEMGAVHISKQDASIIYSGSFNNGDLRLFPTAGNLFNSGIGGKAFIRKINNIGIPQFEIFLNISPLSRLEIKDISTDNLGNTIIGGELFGSVDFDPSTNLDVKTSNGLNDVFIAKYDPIGNYLGSLVIGSTGADSFAGLDVGSANQIVATYDVDTTAGAINYPVFGSVLGNGSTDIHLAYLSPTLSVLNVLNLGSTGADKAGDVAVDSLDNIILTGSFNGTVDFDPTAVVSNLVAGSTQNNLFLTKYNTSGSTLLWKYGGAIDFGMGRKVVVNNANDIYLGATIGGNAQAFGSSDDNLDDVVMSKFSQNGNMMWSGIVKNFGADELRQVRVSGNCNVLGLGKFNPTTPGVDADSTGLAVINDTCGCNP